MVAAGAAGVLAIYLYGTDRQPQDAAETVDPSACRVTVTADVLNVRAGPSVGALVVGKYNQGAETEAEKVVENGFRKLAENRWASDQYLAPKDGHDCTS
jgi:hypothetical protein